MTDDRAEAMQAFRDAVGSEHVLTDPAALSTARAGTFDWPRRIRAIVRPASRAEVQACVGIANRCSVPVYPVSTGRNWGFGSSAPVADDCVILNLARMDRILEVDETLGYATIEPGVTQRQLFEHLRRRGSRLWVDVTASSPECSLVGNVLERGIGFTPYADHASNACLLEVVLPTGECIETGFGGLPNARAASVFRPGTGPSLDGLFTQSSLGIVTRLTLWLMPAPERFLACYFNVRADERLELLVDAIRELRADAIVRGAVQLFNDFAVLSSIRQYPWEEAYGSTPLPSQLMESLRASWDLGAWHGSVGLYGTVAQVRCSRRRIRRTLGPLVRRLQFLDARRLWMARRLERPYRVLRGGSLAELLSHTLPGYGLLQGVPTDAVLRSAYWRLRGPPPASMDPARDGCGLIWCTPVIPLEGAHARSVVNIARRILPAHGFEPMVAMHVVTDRAAQCTIALSYDRSVAGEDERARECQRRLLTALSRDGYYPYRLDVGSMRLFCDAASARRGVLRRLKRALDPNDILAPGRYT